MAKGETIMPTDAQVLIGKVLQIKDKLYAKRHSIPTDLQKRRTNLIRKPPCFKGKPLFQPPGKVKQISKKTGEQNA